jgi:hypothetical protein
MQSLVIVEADLAAPPHQEAVLRLINAYARCGLYGHGWETRPAGYEVLNHAVDTRRLL